MKIAIIGAGIGGSATSYFAREQFGEGAEIVVYEKNFDRIGGRLSTVEIDKENYECGGSVIHSRNRYMVDFAKKLKLPQNKGHSELLGLYDGEEFLFQEKDSTLMTLFSLLWRYGLDTVRMKFFVNSFLNSFDKIYELQNQGLAFTSPQKLVSILDHRFADSVLKTVRELLLENGFSEPFVSELAQGIMRVNYGQTTEIGGFAGVVSLAGTGGSLWSVKGGNHTLAEAILHQSASRIVMGGNVEQIIATPQGERDYTISYKHGGETETENFDVVFLCSPLDSTSEDEGIEFKNIGASASAFARPYHQTVASFVQGKCDFSMLCAKSSNPKPTMILTTNDKVWFNSLGIYHNVDDNGEAGVNPVWKIFSQSMLDSEKLGKLFSGEDVKSKMKVRPWKAYPDYSTKENREKVFPFEIDGNHLYYINAIEGVASAMEMSCIGAKNCVLLAWNKKQNEREKIDPIGVQSKL